MMKKFVYNAKNKNEMINFLKKEKKEDKIFLYGASTKETLFTVL